VELSLRVSGAGRACALVVAFVLSAARAAAADSASPVPAAEVAAPPPELASTVAAPIAPAPAPAAPPTSRAPANGAPPEPYESVVVGHRSRGKVARDPTASATVIDADRFQGEAKNVAELVATAPGVAVNEYGGLGHLTTVSIRGAAAGDVLVLLDGLPLATVLGGGVDLATIPRSWIDRIEIVRGPEGAHYGAGALGGVVNVVTRRGGPGTWSLESGAGSFGTYSLSAEGTGHAAGGTLLASASAESTAGDFPYRFDPEPSVPGTPTQAAIRDNDAVRRAGGVVKGAWSFGSARFDAAAQAFAGRRELPGGLYGLTPRNWQEDALVLLSARISAPGPREGLLLAARSSLRLDRVDVRVDPSTARQRGGAAGLQGEARLAHGDGLLRAVLEGEGETLDADGLGASRARTSLAASISDDLGVAGGRVRLGPALRVERVGEFSGISAKAGASARLAGPVSVRASAGRTFRAPSFSELYLAQGLVQPNPDLRPEEGLGADAGLVAEHAAGFAAIGAHATLYRDLIFYEPATLGVLKPFNAGRALVRGIEAEAALAPVRHLAGLSLSTSYTLLDSRILRGVYGTLGNELPHRARHRLYARASVAPGPFEAHAELHVVGRQFADSHNLGEIPGATTWNAGVSLRLARRPSLRLHVEVRNLLDDRNLQDALGNPLPSRTVLLTLRAGPALTEEGTGTP